MALSSKLPHSCCVYHDVQLGEEEGKGSNTDHVILTPNEVIIVDAKYRRLQKNSSSNTIVYDGNSLQFGSEGFKSARDIETILSVRKQFENYLKREGIAKIDIPIRCVLIYPGWQIDFSKAIGNQPPVQVSATSVLINRVSKNYSESKISDGSTQDRINQLLDAKNIVKTDKF
jgi:Tfp pilus assembly protein FimT